MPDWLAQMLHNLILTGQCTDITLELNDSLMTQVLDSGTVSTSSDFVLAAPAPPAFKRAEQTAAITSLLVRPG